MASKSQPYGLKSLLGHPFTGFPYEMSENDNTFLKGSLSVSHKPAPMKDSQYYLVHNKHSADAQLNNKGDG